MQPKQKIAFIGQKGYPKDFVGTTGIEYYVEEKIRSFSKKNYDIAVYIRPWTTSEPPRTNKGNRIHVISLPTINTTFLDALTHSFLATIHANFIWRADIVWYQGCGPGIFMVIPILSGKTVWMTVHTLDWARKKWGRVSSLCLRIAEFITIHGAHKLFTPSYRMQSYIRHTYKKSSVIDRVIPKLNGIQNVPFHNLQKKYHIRPNYYLLYVGRLSPEKRIDWLIRAYLHLSPKNTKLIIAGGSSHTDTYERELKILASSNSNIIFSGYVLGKEKNALIAHCRLFILPSEIDAFPIALLEALVLDKKCLVPNFLKKEHLPSRKLLTFFDPSMYTDFLGRLHKAIR